MKGLTQVDNKGKNATGREVKPVFPGKSLPWETTNYGFVPVEVEAVCVQCVYSVCRVALQSHVCLQQHSHENTFASVSPLVMN